MKSLLVVLLIAGSLMCAPPTWAGDGGTAHHSNDGCCATRCDDIWMICTRRSPGCIDAQEAAFPTFTLKHYDTAAGRWVDGRREEFFAGPDSVLPTTVWVHGDRIEDEDVYEVGMSVYKRLTETQGSERIRYVIWSWPASVEHLLRPIKDARLKGSNAMRDGYRLGWVLAHMQNDTPVNLIGYSAAGRIIYGAMHGMGGGLVAGYPVLGEGQVPGPPRYSVVTFATAVDNYWLEPGQPFGQAVGQIDRMLLLNNLSDKILQHYPKLTGNSALGFTGLANRFALGEHLDRIAEVNAGSMIGPHHRWKNYVYSNEVMPMIRDYGLPTEGTVIQHIADSGDVDLVDGMAVVIEDALIESHFSTVSFER